MSFSASNNAHAQLKYSHKNVTISGLDSRQFHDYQTFVTNRHCLSPYWLSITPVAKIMNGACQQFRQSTLSQSFRE